MSWQAESTSKSVELEGRTVEGINNLEELQNAIHNRAVELDYSNYNVYVEGNKIVNEEDLVYAEVADNAKIAITPFDKNSL